MGHLEGDLVLARVGPLAGTKVPPVQRGSPAMAATNSSS